MNDEFIPPPPQADEDEDDLLGGVSVVEHEDDEGSYGYYEMPAAGARYGKHNAARIAFAVLIAAIVLAFHVCRP